MLPSFVGLMTLLILSLPIVSGQFIKLLEKNYTYNNEFLILTWINIYIQMNILFLQTGGTIDKDYPKSTKGYAFEIHEPDIKRILQKLNPSFKFNF